MENRNREECEEDLRPGKKEYQKCFEDIKYIRTRKRSGIIQCFTDDDIPVDINIDQHLPQPQKKTTLGDPNIHTAKMSVTDWCRVC